MAARLEVLLGRVVSACHQHAFFRRPESPPSAGTQPSSSPPELSQLSK
ncbi:MAG: hypothetical protein GWO24_12765 [Akkermansiaceae bacterium]|nr:hypothetical protein [Akkermansiaceae bacterium]